MTARKPLEVVLTAEEVDQLFATRRGGPSAARPPELGKPKAFLSYSFNRGATSVHGVDEIKRVLETSLDITSGASLGGRPQLASIVNKIRQSTAVIIDATFITGNVMLELGAAYAVAPYNKTRVFITQNRDANRSDIRELPSYVRHFDIITYGINEESLARLRDAVMERLAVEPDDVDTMSRNLLGISLRKTSLRNCVFLYFPAGKPIWRVIIPELRAKLAKEELRLVTLDVAPSGSSSLEALIYGISLSRRKRQGVSCFFDISSGANLDLVAAMGMGVGIALQRAVVCLSETDMTDQISLWTQPVYQWRTKDELMDTILRNALKPAKEISREHG